MPFLGNVWYSVWMWTIWNQYYFSEDRSSLQYGFCLISIYGVSNLEPGWCHFGVSFQSGFCPFALDWWCYSIEPSHWFSSVSFWCAFLRNHPSFFTSHQTQEISPSPSDVTWWHPLGPQIAAYWVQKYVKIILCSNTHTKHSETVFTRSVLEAFWVAAGSQRRMNGHRWVFTVYYTIVNNRERCSLFSQCMSFTVSLFSRKISSRALMLRTNPLPPLLISRYPASLLFIYLKHFPLHVFKTKEVHLSKHSVPVLQIQNRNKEHIHILFHNIHEQLFIYLLVS